MQPPPDTTFPAPSRLKIQPGLALAGLIVLLALVEAGVAMVSPRLAPTDADWRAAAAHVNAGFREGDLVVTAPDWADPVLRLHLGAHLPAPIAGRIDHGRFARIWEISQRGADAPELQDARIADERRFGRLRVRLAERTAAALTYDFTARWADATVTREESGQPPVICERQSVQHQCPGIGYNFVRSAVLEIGNQPRQALYAQPIANATVAVTYPNVPLGRELAVAGGLHNAWLRKVANGSVVLRALVDGSEVGRLESGNRSGWQVQRFDTSRWAGKTGTVRFEITSVNPFSRHFGWAAEARGR